MFCLVVHGLKMCSHILHNLYEYCHRLHIPIQGTHIVLVSWLLFLGSSTVSRCTRGFGAAAIRPIPAFSSLGTLSRSSSAIPSCRPLFPAWPFGHWLRGFASWLRAACSSLSAGLWDGYEWTVHPFPCRMQSPETSSYEIETRQSTNKYSVLAGFLVSVFGCFPLCFPFTGFCYATEYVTI